MQVRRDLSCSKFSLDIFLRASLFLVHSDSLQLLVAQGYESPLVLEKLSELNFSLYNRHLS